jgi:hypothetical protein
MIWFDGLDTGDERYSSDYFRQLVIVIEAVPGLLGIVLNSLEVP